MALPDIQVYLNAYENISPADMNALSGLAFEIQKTFVNTFISTTACRFKGLVPTFSTLGTNRSVDFSAGLALYVLPVDDGLTSGALFYSGARTFSVPVPALSTRTDSFDISYQEVLGSSRSDGGTEARNLINADGTITPDAQMHTRKRSSYTLSYIDGSDTKDLGAGPGNPAPGTLRLFTLTITPAGVMTSVYLMPSIWENQTWPRLSYNNPNGQYDLMDGLAAIRCQLKNILGSSNWFDAPAASLQDLLHTPRVYSGGLATGDGAHYSVTCSDYYLVTGNTISFLADYPNTGASTMSINGGTFYPIVDSAGNALIPGSLQHYEMCQVIWTGSTYQMVSGTPATMYWGSTDTSTTPNTVTLTVNNFPADGQVRPGTVVTFIINNTVTGPTTVAFNGSATTYALNDSANAHLSNGGLISGTIYQIVYNGTGYQLMASGVSTVGSYFNNQYVIRTTAGSWTFTPNSYYVTIDLISAGGGGAYGAGGYGGGSGAWSRIVIPVAPGVPCTYSVGGGGLSGTSGAPAGLQGGTTSFTTGTHTYAITGGLGGDTVGPGAGGTDVYLMLPNAMKGTAESGSFCLGYSYGSAGSGTSGGLQIYANGPNGHTYSPPVLPSQWCDGGSGGNNGKDGAIIIYS